VLKRSPASPAAEARHFVDLKDHDRTTLRDMLARAKACKAGALGDRQPLAGRTLAMIFEKPSTRTRVSFEVGMRQLGGSTIFLAGNEMQLGRGESLGDTARVLSRYVDAIMIRTDRHDKVAEMAAHATVPVINGLTDDSHPCQLMADVMTFEEWQGPIAGQRVAWSGDGNNVARTWIHAAARFGFELCLACPPELNPPRHLLDWAKAEGAAVSVTNDPRQAAAGAACVVTDTWVSMGDGEAENRHNMLAPYRVDAALMAVAAENAMFMHCLPAHRGEEVTDEVIDGPRSAVWDEAENRLHAQKGVLAWCFGVEIETPD
jgi:ornithine carbamoyltransferase